MKIILSKSQWELIGQNTGWIKKASSQFYSNGLKLVFELSGNYHKQTLDSPEEFPDIIVTHIKIVNQNELFQSLSNFPQFQQILKNYPPNTDIPFNGLLIHPTNDDSANISIINEQEFLDSPFIDSLLNKYEYDMLQKAIQDSKQF